MKRFLTALGIIVLVLLLAFGTYNYVTATEETIVVEISSNQSGFCSFCGRCIN
jgi:hypothetical protein